MMKPLFSGSCSDRFVLAPLSFGRRLFDLVWLATMIAWPAEDADEVTSDQEVTS